MEDHSSQVASYHYSSHSFYPNLLAASTVVIGSSPDPLACELKAKAVYGAIVRAGPATSSASDVRRSGVAVDTHINSEKSVVLT